jgi:excisionase family DNA binding protein
MEEKFYTLREVAEKLRVCEMSVFRYIHKGRIKAVKVGYWRISEKALEEFLNKNTHNYNL